MKIFLELKHWKLFILWILGIIQFRIFLNSELWIISFLIYFGILFGWIYSIGSVLNNGNPDILKKLNIWSISYLISTIPFIINLRNMNNGIYGFDNGVLLFFASVVGFISIINIVMISAKSLKSVAIENNQQLTFSMYAKEFFLILYFIIGIWILQPKLNQIIKK